MELTNKEIWGLLHGIVFGAIFLMSYTGSMVWLNSYSNKLVSDQGKIVRSKRMVPTMWILCITCWLTLIIGTFIVYPWYRAIPAEGESLYNYAQQLLMSSEHTVGWHEFGMEWKEHIAWLSPFIFTAVAYISTLYKEAIADNDYLRKGLMVLLTIAFFSAAIAALLGALITKKAPIL